MRDAHRMKEKFDLSLDSRQVVSVAIGSLVVLGTVFVLGVVVGKNLSGNEAAQEAPDLLSALDQKAAQLEEVRAQPLTFEEELTKKSAEPSAELPPPEAPKTLEKAPEPAAPPAPPSPLGKPEAPKLAEAPKTEPPAAESAKPEPAAKTQVKGQVEAAPVTARTVTKDGGLKEAFAKVERKAPEATANGQFTLQLSASQSRVEADRFAGILRDKGYAPFIIEAHVPGKGTWYRVRMGSFANRDAAQRYLSDFRRETQLEAFVAGANEGTRAR